MAVQDLQLPTDDWLVQRWRTDQVLSPVSLPWSPICSNEDTDLFVFGMPKLVGLSRRCYRGGVFCAFGSVGMLATGGACEGNDPISSPV